MRRGKEVQMRARISFAEGEMRTAGAEGEWDGRTEGE